MRSVHTDGSAHAHRARTSPVCLAVSGTRSEICSIAIGLSHPPSYAPSLHVLLGRFLATMGVLTPARVSARAGLPASRTRPSDPSVSNHPAIRRRTFDTLPVRSPASPIGTPLIRYRVRLSPADS